MTEIESRTINRAINANMIGAGLTAAGAYALYPVAGDAYFGTYAIVVTLAGGSLICLVQAAKGISRRRDRRRAAALARAEGAARHTARWASDDDLKAAGMFEPNGRPMGLTRDGRPIFAPASAINGLIVAPPGTGKTTANLVPTVMHLALSSDDSIVVADFKNGEIARQCVGPLRRRGIECWVIDDENETKLDRTAVNWLAPLVQAVESESPRAALIARDNALTLEPEPPNDQRNYFFRAGPRLFLTYAQLTLAVHTPELCFPAGLYEFLSSRELFDAQLRRDGEGVGALAALARQIEEFRDSGTHHYTEFLNSAREKLQIYEETGPMAGAGR